MLGNKRLQNFLCFELDTGVIIIGWIGIIGSIISIVFILAGIAFLLSGAMTEKEFRQIGVPPDVDHSKVKTG